MRRPQRRLRKHRIILISSVIYGEVFMYYYFYIAICAIALIITSSITVKILLSNPSVVQAVAVMFFTALLIIEVGLLMQHHSDNLTETVIAFKTKNIGMAMASLLLLRLVEMLCNAKLPKYIYIIQALVTTALIAVFLYLDPDNYTFADWSSVSTQVASLSTFEFIVINVIFPLDLLVIFVACLIIITINLRQYKGIAKKRIICLFVVVALFLISTMIYYATDYVGIDLTIYFILAIVITLAVLLFRFDIFDSIQAAIENVVYTGPLGLVVTDADNNIIFHNDLSSTMITSLKKINLIEEDEQLNKIRTNGGGDYVVDKNTYSVNVTKIMEANDLAGYQYVISDVTDLHSKMEELERMTDVANKANQTKSIFLANMSHEIRTPINAIIGMDEMILREATDQAIKEYASDIKSASQTLLGIINDILDISKIEAGSMTLNNADYKLSNVILDVNNMVANKARNKGLDFNLAVDENVPENLYGDELRLRQILINIINNAIKYTEKGSIDVNISYRDIPDKSQRIELVATVADTGIGIKKEDMDSLFVTFRRLDEIRNRKVEGTGLGLSIAKTFVTMMDGNIDVASEYGKGTTFTVFLCQKVTSTEIIGDIAKRIESKVTLEESRITFMAPEARILIVDDNDLNLKVITNLLKETRMKMDTAVSGKECLEMLRRNGRYNCVLLDIMMPDMNGVETLHAMVDEGLKGDMPVIALTADATSGAAKTYQDEGFDEYLTKPISYEKCEATLINFLPDELLLSKEEIEKALAKPTVLVIDDEPDELKKHKEVLSGAYKGVYVKNKKAADKYLDTHQPDYIFKKYNDNKN